LQVLHDRSDPARSQSAPYLTVVATARNDNHGGDLLHRMQVFVSGLAAQCERYSLPAELILVEWNPPADREHLADALEWPTADSYLQVRIVEVPPEVHASFDYAARLPLFQMIAKNVGIRRARGRFVLATNVDVLLSDDLMGVIAEHRLQDGRLYRADRYDVDADLDPDSPVEGQLADCATHVIRICAIHGTTDLRTGEYYPIYGPMSHWPGPLSRWGRLVRFGVPFAFRRAFWLVRGAIAGPMLRFQHLFAYAWTAAAWRLHTWKVTNFALLAYAARRGFGRTLVHALQLQLSRAGRTRYRELKQEVLAAACGDTPPRRPSRLKHTIGDELRHLLGAFRRTFRRAGRAIGSVPARWKLVQAMWEQEKARVMLHTNACGDFTLMSRDDWFRLRGYAELEIFSMHLDSLLLFEAHYGGVEHVQLAGPVYHLEHGGGFKPDSVGLKQLNDRLDRDAIPQISNEQFLDWVVQMFRQRRPLTLNEADWGLADVALPEVVLSGAEREAAATEGVV